MRSLKIILVAFVGCLLFAFSSKEGKTPQKVKDAFVKKFPTAKKVKWEKENVTEWEAEFKMNKVEYSANFLEDGTWKETEYEIEERDIPQNLKSVLLAAFPEYEIEEAEISETLSRLVYEFSIEKGETEMEVAIDSTGKIVKEEAKKREYKD